MMAPSGSPPRLTILSCRRSGDHCPSRRRGPMSRKTNGTGPWSPATHCLTAKFSVYSSPCQHPPLSGLAAATKSVHTAVGSFRSTCAIAARATRKGTGSLGVAARRAIIGQTDTQIARSTETQRQQLGRSIGTTACSARSGVTTPTQGKHGITLANWRHSTNG
jgi:hypothetical protein